MENEEEQVIESGSEEGAPALPVKPDWVIEVLSATHDFDDAILFVLNTVEDPHMPFAYRESDPYSGELGLWLTQWLIDNADQVQPYVAPPPPPPVPYSFAIDTLWGRMTDEEAETFDSAMAVASPLRLRRQFQSAQTMMSDSELFTFTQGVLSGALTEARATELLAQ